MIVAFATAKSARTLQIGCRSRVAQRARRIALNDMARGDHRRSHAKKGSGNSWSTQQQRNCRWEKRVVTDDRRPAVEFGEVLGAMFRCELLV